MSYLLEGGFLMENNVLGIISFILGFIGFLSAHWYFGIFFILLSILLGAIACTNYLAEKYTSIFGFIFSGLGILLFVWTLVTDMESGRLIVLYDKDGIVNEIENSIQESYEGETLEEIYGLTEEKDKQEEPKTEPKGVSDSNEKETQYEKAVEKAKIESSDKKDENNTGTIDIKFDSFEIVYDGYEISKDYEGNDCVVIYYYFTNYREEPTSAVAESYIKCFQNGVQCDSTVLSYGTNEHYENQSRQITKGTTLKCANAYNISSLDDVYVTAQEVFSLTGENDDMTIKLK